MTANIVRPQVCHRGINIYEQTGNTALILTPGVKPVSRWCARTGGNGCAWSGRSQRRSACHRARRAGAWAACDKFRAKRQGRQPKARTPRKRAAAEGASPQERGWQRPRVGGRGARKRERRAPLKKERGRYLHPPPNRRWPVLRLGWTKSFTSIMVVIPSRTVRISPPAVTEMTVSLMPSPTTLLD